MKMEYWFPTPVLIHEIPEHTQKMIADEFFSREQDIKNYVSQGVWGDNIGSSAINESNILKKLNIPYVEEIVSMVAQEFIDHFKIKKQLICTEAWVNYQNKYQYQNVHDHFPFDVSACYYIQATPNDGNFRLYPPSSNMGQWNLSREGNPAHTIEYNPKPGLILVFPAWAMHSVSQNMTDNTRISIAINYKFKI